MDRVRFGRALGVGAREAAKALVKAADAAAAPSPVATRKAGASVAGRVAEVRASGAGVKRGGKRFGQAVWAPMAKAGGTLWLEVTGVLFGMFVAAFGIWVWKARADLWGAGPARQKAWFAVAMLVIFTYFTVSSYVKAARRGR